MMKDGMPHPVRYEKRDVNPEEITPIFNKSLVTLEKKKLFKANHHTTPFIEDPGGTCSSSVDEFANKTTAPQILHAFAVRLASDILSRVRSSNKIGSFRVGPKVGGVVPDPNILEANEFIEGLEKITIRIRFMIHYDCFSNILEHLHCELQPSCNLQLYPMHFSEASMVL